MVKNLTDSVHATGYDREAEYFHEQNQELIERLHESQHGWENRCPACGGGLKASAVPDAQGDVCEKCGGVFLRREQLESLASGSSTHTLRDHAKRLLHALTRPLPTGIGQFPV